MQKILLLTKRGCLFLLTVMMLTIVSCGGGAGGDNNDDSGEPDITLESIEITPAIPSIALGTNQQFTAIGIYSDNTDQNLTDSVTWGSSNTAVAAISTKGIAQGSTEGTTTITATSLDGTSETTELIVIRLTEINELPDINPQHDTYSDNSDQTVSDIITGLRWQKNDDNTQRIWADAITYCDTLELGGYTDYTDWRLPTKKELITIVDYGTTSRPVINQGFFPNTKILDYWSSTTYAGKPKTAWGVYFGSGMVDGDSKLKEKYVRCVRVDS